MSGEKDFTGAVADKAGCSREDAGKILTRHNIYPSTDSFGSRHLHVDQIKFRGEKTVENDSHSSKSVEPFKFESKFESGLSALLSHKNSAGKTSILEIIVWALRGNPKGLQADVRQWLRHVELEGKVGDEAFSVCFDVENGSPKGELRTGHEDLPRKFNSKTMQSVMSDFMLDRLGFTPEMSVQERNSGNPVKDKQEEWFACTTAFYFRRANQNAVIGENFRGFLADKRLQIYLRSPWTPVVLAAETVNKDFVKIQQNEWEKRLRECKKALDEAEKARKQILLENALYGQPRDLVQEIEKYEGLRDEISRELHAKEKEYESLEKLWLTKRQDALDRQETSAVADVFRRLQPDRCPRCYTEITQERRRAEAEEGICSICGTEEAFGNDAASLLLGEAEEEAAAGVVPGNTADRDEFLAAKEQLKAHITCLEEKLAGYRDKSRETTDELHNLIKTSDENVRQEKEAEVVRAREKFEEEKKRYKKKFPGRALSLGKSLPFQEGLPFEEDAETESPDDLEKELSVIDAALEEAKKRRETESKDLFTDINEEIVKLAKAFGVHALESVDMKLDGKLKLCKSGGRKTDFAACSPGEKTRLRIAVLLALLRVGTQHEVGRFPGLLLIDALCAEETEEADAVKLLEQLRLMAEEMPHLQIIVTSARPEVFCDIPEEHKITAEPGCAMW